MGILFGLFRQMRTWDAATRAALAIAVALLLVVLAILSAGPEAVRPVALFGAAGLVFAIQVIVLWGNRHLLKPHALAQRHYLAGDYEQARDVLLAAIAEREAAGKPPAVESLVLLGNTYRRLGALDKSQEQFTQALQLQAGYPFALQGFGRTLVARGDYAGAVDVLRQAAHDDAPPLVTFDLGHALYRAGAADAAAQTLRRVLPDLGDDPESGLLARTILYRLGAGEPPDPALIAQGLAIWRAEAERWAQTPYGAALARDLATLQQLVERADDVSER